MSKPYSKEEAILFTKTDATTRVLNNMRRHCPEPEHPIYACIFLPTFEVPESMEFFKAIYRIAEDRLNRLVEACKVKEVHSVHVVQLGFTVRLYAHVTLLS